MVSECTHRGAVNESPHRVVKKVGPNTNKVDIVGEAGYEAVLSGNRRDFEESEACAKHPLAQHADVNFESRDVSVLDRLPRGEQGSHFVEKIVTQADDGRTR